MDVEEAGKEITIPSDSETREDPMAMIVVASDDECNEDDDYVDDDWYYQFNGVRFGADFMEVYSPLRVAVAIMRLGMSSGGSFDLLNGCDLLSTQGRAMVLRALEHQKPLMLMVSPPCTMYSELMRLWNLKKMAYEVRKLREQEAYLMVRFAFQLCRMQDDAGRFFASSIPIVQAAGSWTLQLGFNSFGVLADVK